MAERFSEDELRALLERAVPQLPAPAQRLERVRARALRRRRRRLAGVSATAVVAVALAGLLLPGLGDRDADQDARRAPDSSRTLAPPASGTAPTTDGRTSAPPTSLGTTRPFHFNELSGFQLALPGDWSTLTAPKTGAVYVASQSLGLPPDGCVKPLDGFCTPLVRTLSPGGALMMLTLIHNQSMADKLRIDTRSVGATALLTSCRTVGGTAQLGTAIADPSGSDVVIQATVCLAGPTTDRRAQVQDALTTADFT